MTNENAFSEILDSLPPKAARSRLEPYSKLIFELHRRGRTYREIAKVLSERCNLQTSRSTVNDFVRARLQRKRNKSRPIDKKLRAGAPTSGHKSNISAETAADEIHKRIEDLRHRQRPTEKESELFQYDPDQPLKIMHAKAAEK
jgi:hypothetical protein